MLALEGRPSADLEWRFVTRFHAASPADLPGTPPGDCSGQAVAVAIFGVMLVQSLRWADRNLGTELERLDQNSPR